MAKSKKLKFKVGDPVIHSEVGPGEIAAVDADDSTLPYRIWCFNDQGHRIKRWVYANMLQAAAENPAEPKEVFPEPKSRDTRKWCFKVKATGDIDFSRIQNDLSSERPIALVTAGETHFVVVHPRLMNKASHCRLWSPWPVHERVKTIYKIGVGTIGQWIGWAQRVRQAPWGDKKPVRDGSVEVRVVLPRVG